MPFSQMSLVTASRAEVGSAYASSGKRGDVWIDFGRLPTTAHGLVPIYFHGTCQADVLTTLNYNGEPATESSDPTGMFDSHPVTFRDVEVAAAFVNGVAYLDSDPDSGTGLHPPQVRYIIAITLGSVMDKKRIVLRGVEPWGPCSGAGVFGVSLVLQTPGHSH